MEGNAEKIEMVRETEMVRGMYVLKRLRWWETEIAEGRWG
jgi:hypothetical protein